MVCYTTVDNKDTQQKLASPHSYRNSGNEVYISGVSFRRPHILGY